MSYQQQFHRWLHSDALSPEEKAQLQAIADDPKEVEDRFFGLLEFGTAGLRGVMGLGLRRMNVHVIRHATQAFAQDVYKRQSTPSCSPGSPRAPMPPGSWPGGKPWCPETGSAGRSAHRGTAGSPLSDRTAPHSVLFRSAPSSAPGFPGTGRYPEPPQRDSRPLFRSPAR